MPNNLLDQIKDYPFEQLANLLPNFNSEEGLKMYIGEPTLTPPPFVGEIILEQQHLFGKYPTVMGLQSLREAIYNYLDRRYGLNGISLDANNQILPTVGSKEGLYCIGTLLSPLAATSQEKNIYLIPNPFYQVYKATAILNGATPMYLSATKENDFQPDISELPIEVLKRTKLAFICNPSNPQGAIMDLKKLVKAVETARKYDFTLVFDECYTDLYNHEKPTGALDAVRELNGSLDNIIISHTLSKRSSAVGLRSGFIAGDYELITTLKKLRSYMSPVIPEPIMHASIALWNDDNHVEENRQYYRENFKVADEVFKNFEGYRKTEGAIYLWLPVNNSIEAALKLWQDLKVKVLPGDYLGSAENSFNPGSGYIRITLNYEAKVYKETLPKIKTCLEKM